MKKIILSMLLLVTILLTGCAEKEQVVNLYTSRHYDADQELLDQFTEETGITVNVVKDEGSTLITRMEAEGEDTLADLFITSDAANLEVAKSSGLLQSIENEVLNENIPNNLRDDEGYWFGLTMRARVIVYSLDRVSPDELSTYEDLVNDKWVGKILIRSASNIYNQSLLSSFVATKGYEEAKEWASVIKNNMARTPEGNDRAQAIAVAAGIGDIAIMNTYYIGKMIYSDDAEQTSAVEKVGVFFPNQDNGGTHVNISGIGLTKHAKNKDNAIKLMEYLTEEDAQSIYASANYEYPVNPNVEPSELLKSWGEFETQDINLSLLGEFNKDAVAIFEEVNWDN
ncbi:Fe(3+) ABC transporter substrate-binding protein [Mycoplasmatota bacterium]|nr:Fe(3+) ABC transporter substrate-binding protein [Mycoplasmatota bacterium]